MLPSSIEETGEHITALRPFRFRQAGYARNQTLIFRKAALLPVPHDQQQIGAMLQCCEVARVGEIVVNVEWHPRRAHLRHPIS